MSWMHHASMLTVKCTDNTAFITQKPSLGGRCVHLITVTISSIFPVEILSDNVIYKDKWLGVFHSISFNDIYVSNNIIKVIDNFEDIQICYLKVIIQ